MSARRIAVIGAGGFAREVRWLIQDLDESGASLDFAGFVVSDVDRLGETDSRDDVVGDYSWLSVNENAIDGAAIGIGTPSARLRVAQEVRDRLPGIEFPALIHPTVTMHRASATIEQGVVVCAGTIATVNVVLREFCMVNLACTLGHESEIGAGSVLNPTVNISGGVRIGRQVLVGTGSQVLQNLDIGDGAVVGAGAVVNRDVPAGQTVVGVPARPLTKT